MVTTPTGMAMKNHWSHDDWGNMMPIATTFCGDVTVEGCALSGDTASNTSPDLVPDTTKN